MSNDFTKGQTIYRRGPSGPFVPVVDPNIQQKVFHTRAYEQFQFAPENRPVYKKHVEHLKQSIKENGYLRHSPIHVTTAADGRGYVVTDGQHRLQACIDLGVDVYYVVNDYTNEADKSAAIRVVNAYSRSWREEDYLAHFCTLGNPHYLRLRQFMADMSLSIHAAIAILQSQTNYTARTEVRHGFRIGSLNFSDAAEAAARRMMVQVNEIRHFHARMDLVKHDSGFLNAVIKMVAADHYDHQRFLDLLAVNLAYIVRCTSTKSYLAILSEIFNYRRSKHRVLFTAQGSKRLYDTEIKTGSVQ
jgi:hypothetical protein